jgi:hypothetical protein
VRRVDVAPEVRDYVPPRQLEEFCAALAETEVTCVVCGEDLPAGSTAPVAVQVFVDPSDATVSSIVASHARCAPSGIHQRPGLAERLSGRSGAAMTELDVRWCPLILPSGHAGVAWEASERVVTWQDDPADAVTALVAAYLKLGFDLVTPGQIEGDTLPELPVPSGWQAELGEEGHLTVLSPDGNAALSVSVDAETLGQLQDAVTQKAQLVALTGCNLHLDSEHREAGLVYAATQGSLVGARVPARVT